MTQSVARHRTKTRITRMMAALAVIAGLAAGACGDGDENGASSGMDPGEDLGGPSIKAYVYSTDGTRERVEFGVSGSPLPRVTGTGTVSERGDGTATKGQAWTIGVNGAPPTPVDSPHPYLLAQYAAFSCSAEGAPGTGGATVPIPWLNSEGVHVWAQRSGFSFSGTCDRYLQAQQAMLCGAAKLAEVADAVEPVSWSLSFGSTESILIPPQSERDRVVAREQAIGVLAALADYAARGQVDGYEFADLGPVEYCPDAYREILSDPLKIWRDGYLGGRVVLPSDEPLRSTLIAGPVAPDIPVTVTNARQLIAPRAKYQAHMLRAAGRLLRRLIEDQVGADLSGAEQASVNGLTEAWGIDDDSTYGTYRHGFRMLFGRWESFIADGAVPSTRFQDLPGPLYAAEYDRECGGLPSVRVTGKPQDLVDAVTTLPHLAALGAPRTGNQAIAADLFVNLGLVVPLENEVGEVSYQPTQLRAALEAEAVRQGASRFGTSPEDFEVSAAGVATLDTIAGLPDDDIHYGARRAVRIYAALVGSGESITGPSDRLPASTAAPAVEAIRGFVVEGGLPVADLLGSAQAVYGPAMAAARCDEEAVLTYQDAMWTARRFDTVLASLGDDSSIQEVVKPARNELAALAGTNGQMPVIEGGFVDESCGQNDSTCDSDDPASGPRFDVEFADLPLGWEELESFDDLKNRMVFVFGDSAMADCVAGLRDRCEGFQLADAMMAPAASWEDLSQNGTLSARISLQGGGFAIRSRTTPGALVHVVLTRPVGAGRVLASFHPGESSGRHALSDWRDRLLNNLRPGGRLEHSGDCSSTVVGSTTQYCVDGMSREQFVPVANAISSAGTGDVDDSWRHYLGLAKEASAKADELGRQIIELGTTRDLRREGAQESLGEMCGGFPDEASLEEPDSAAAACLEEPGVDMVYFGDARTLAQAQQDIEAVGLCSGSTAALCTRLQALTADDIEGLGFPTVGDDEPDTVASDPGLCDGLLKGVGEFVRTAGVNGIRPEEFQIAALNQELSQPAFSNAAARFRLEVGIRGSSWVLRRGGTPLMAWVDPPVVEPQHETTDPAPELNGFFPGCLHLPASWACQSGDCCNATAKSLMAQLGGDGNAFSQNEWRRMLEGGLWATGYLAGAVPEKMFSVPVPVAAFEDPAEPGQSAFWNWDGDLVPAALIYGNSRFKSAGTKNLELLNGDVAAFLSYALDPNENGRETSRDLGLVVPASTEFLSARSNNRLYGWALQPGRTLVALATNEFRSYAAPSYPEPPSTYQSFFGPYEFNSGWACYQGEFPMMIDSRITGTRILGSSCDDEIPSPTEKEIGLGTTESRVGFVFEGGCFDSPTLTWSCASQPDEYLDKNFVSETCSNLSFRMPPAAGVPGQLPVCMDCDQRWAVHAGRRTLEDCGPSDRVSMALDLQHSPRTLRHMATLASCLAKGQSKLEVATPPVVETVAQVPLLKEWMRGQADALALAQQSMFLIDVPEKVVEFHQTGLVPYGLVGTGARGDQLLELANALEGIHSGFRQVISGMRQMQSAVGASEVGLEAAELAGERDMLRLAFQKVEVGRQSTLAAIQIADGLTSTGNIFAAVATVGQSTTSGLSQVVSGTVSLTAFAEQNGILVKEQRVAAAQQANQISGVLQGLNDGLANGIEQMEAGFSQIRAAQLSSLQVQNRIAQRENEASYERAKLTGASFATVTDADGNETVVALPVNTVYRRQYEILRERYRRALDSAKRYAYLTRLAIEQRLGVRLLTLTEGLGPVESPASWVEDLCSTQGVDYDALRTDYEDDDYIDGGTDFEEGELIREFADQYIGDYVAKLEEMVEFYNIRYPFQGTDDTAVLSVREHILARAACSSLPNNLLASSGDLTSVGVWVGTGCSDSSCLSTDEAGYFETPSDPLTWVPIPPPVSGGATLLTRAQVAGGVTDELAIEQDGFPTAVLQEVALDAQRTYELSWWDSSRSADGTPSSTSQNYRVLVADEEWQPWSIKVLTASSSDWGTRKTIRFSVPQGGVFRIGFQLIEDGTIGIANAQLVDTSPAPAQTFPYVHTGPDGGTDCAAFDNTTFAEEFERKCDDDGCYFELETAIRISERDVLAGVLSGAGLPADNYNYRHVSVSLNAVGTELIDCSGQESSCYSTGFLEYDLEHSAFDARITDYGGQQQCFSFGRGAVSRGKMLAAERVIGIPLSGTDQQLLDGPAFTKGTLRGRPLDGLYTLRIYERPGLNLNNLEDVQLVLNHHYWSRVERTQ